ncbi:hypothetical protein DPMN_033681 [Dreissena polymorpha]|uniref:Uncharacterized protein n=1 Tax=Dreissena polymorpha TaxID=45954 RepID=A0A9D4RK36_DREPO|nr:hypothetical protein DPMN_033681 [Dreissena polymorpha]
MSKDMERRSCCSEFVYLDITEDVAVFLPAYKLNGLCLKRKKMEVKTGKVKREKPTMTKKKNKQMTQPVNHRPVAQPARVVIPRLYLLHFPTGLSTCL